MNTNTIKEKIEEMTHDWRIDNVEYKDIEKWKQDIQDLIIWELNAHNQELMQTIELLRIAHKRAKIEDDPFCYGLYSGYLNGLDDVSKLLVEGESQKKRPTGNIREELSKILIKWDMPTRQAAISEIVQLFDGDIDVTLNIGQLRQWLNEDRIKDAKLFVTNEEIEYWLGMSLKGGEEKI